MKKYNVFGYKFVGIIAASLLLCFSVFLSFGSRHAEAQTVIIPYLEEIKLSDGSSLPGFASNITYPDKQTSIFKTISPTVSKVITCTKTTEVRINRSTNLPVSVNVITPSISYRKTADINGSDVSPSFALTMVQTPDYSSAITGSISFGVAANADGAVWANEITKAVATLDCSNVVITDNYDVNQCGKEIVLSLIKKDLSQVVTLFQGKYKQSLTNDAQNVLITVKLKTDPYSIPPIPGATSGFISSGAYRLDGADRKPLFTDEVGKVEKFVSFKDGSLSGSGAGTTPDVNLRVSSNKIVEGESVVLTWNSTNVKNCVAKSDPGSWTSNNWSGSVPSTNNTGTSLKPSTTRNFASPYKDPYVSLVTYTLTCVSNDSSQKQISSAANVIVVKVPNTPGAEVQPKPTNVVISKFEYSDDYNPSKTSVDSGKDISVAYNVTAAKYCVVNDYSLTSVSSLSSRDERLIMKPVLNVGNSPVSVNYKLTCVDYSGSNVVTKDFNLTINPPKKSSITTFSFNKGEIVSGNPVELKVSAENVYNCTRKSSPKQKNWDDLTSKTLDLGISNLYPVNTGTSPVDVTYSVACTDASGNNPVSASAQVTVKPLSNPELTVIPNVLTIGSGVMGVRDMFNPLPGSTNCKRSSAPKDNGWDKLNLNSLMYSMKENDNFYSEIKTPGDVTYTVTCDTPYGQKSASAVITFKSVGTPTITSFTITPNEITSGSTALPRLVAGFVDRCTTQSSPKDESWDNRVAWVPTAFAGNDGMNLSWNATSINPPVNNGTTPTKITYSVTCFDKTGGKSVKADAIVTVKPVVKVEPAVPPTPVVTTPVITPNPVITTTPTIQTTVTTPSVTSTTTVTSTGLTITTSKTNVSAPAPVNLSSRISSLSTIPLTPTVSLNVSTTQIPSGGTVVVYWSTVNAKSCSASSSDGSWTGSKNLAGSENVVLNNPATTTVLTIFYSLACSDATGTKTTASNAVVQVSPAVSAPIPKTTISTKDFPASVIDALTRLFSGKSIAF